MRKRYSNAELRTGAVTLALSVGLAFGLATANVAEAVTTGQARHAEIVYSSKATASNVIALEDKTMVVGASDRQPLGALLAPRVNDAILATRHCNINWERFLRGSCRRPSGHYVG